MRTALPQQQGGPDLTPAQGHPDAAQTGADSPQHAPRASAGSGFAAGRGAGCASCGPSRSDRRAVCAIATAAIPSASAWWMRSTTPIPSTARARDEQDLPHRAIVRQRHSSSARRTGVRAPQAPPRRRPVGCDDRGPATPPPSGVADRPPLRRGGCGTASIRSPRRPACAHSGLRSGPTKPPSDSKPAMRNTFTWPAGRERGSPRLRKHQTLHRCCHHAARADAFALPPGASRWRM